MLETNLSVQVLIPIGIIIIGGSLLFWYQYFKDENDYYMWVVPWLFGAVVAGGYIGWLAGQTSNLLWVKILALPVGCVVGLIAGMLGLISDPRLEQEPLEQFITTLALLGMPIGVVIGFHINRVWRIPGPVLGFCLGPIIIGLMATLLISLPKKAATWMRTRFH
jgi:hypothetical protein